MRARIYTSVKVLLDVPPIGDIKKLKDTDNIFRLRVGTIRIIKVKTILLKSYSYFTIMKYFNNIFRRW